MVIGHLCIYLGLAVSLSVNTQNEGPMYRILFDGDGIHI